ncbi:MAG: dihydroxyacetone kinase subunit DhaK [Lachnospiraceae bacterium]
MKKIINPDSEDIIEEMLNGFVAAYPRYYTKRSGANAIVYNHRRKDKVSIVIGGGSGHEPSFCGFAGRGLADAVACGNVFASPNPQLIYETAMAVDEGHGTLFLYGNYAGDNLNFDMAEELCEFEGIKTAHVRVMDDIASAPKERMEDRRGIAGDAFVFKIAGAAADAGLPLDEVTRIAESARDHTFSIGLATSPCTIPGLSKPTFELGEDEIEFGMGIHGEPGIERTTMKPARELVNRMYHLLQEERPIKHDEKLVVLVNGLGSTTILELSIVFHELAQLLIQDHITIYDSELKSFCTSQEMGGFSISFLYLNEELEKYYNAECFSPYYGREAL